jgi:ankyrin repeat protein
MGWTPLHLAAQRGHLAIVKLLVKGGARLDAKTVAIPARFGVPPGSPDGARPQKIPAIPARTPLQVAQDSKQVEVVKFLRARR